jgi:hypothetical protein
MIWKDGPTWEETKRIRAEWHKWFAWYPVVIRIEEGHKIKAWLQYVERKGIYCYGWAWEYRETEV